MNLEKLLRPNIASLTPYSSARDEFSGEASVFLDANESPYNGPFNRYPDPLQLELKKRISVIKNVPVENIFLGNGSDEPIDLLFRAFCEPGKDNVVSIAPTYGMYKVCADINNTEVISVPLRTNFDLDSIEVLRAVNENTKMIFLCSPNNPTGNALDAYEIKHIIEKFEGLVILDEAYIDFCKDKSFVPDLASYPNLVILHTLSKAWAMAALRLGMAFASEEIIKVLNTIKYPYNINLLTQKKVLAQLSKQKPNAKWMRTTLLEREAMATELNKLQFVLKVYPSDANFLLVQVEQPKKIYEFLVDRKIIVRDRSNVLLCENCLRISIGSPEENANLIKSLHIWDDYQK